MKHWKVEVHAHTSPASRCSQLRPKELLELLQRDGYDAVVISDHYDPERFFGSTKGRRFRSRLKDLYDGWREAADLGGRYGIEVFQAAELRLERGNEDYLLYGFTEEMALDVGYLGSKSLARVRDILSPLGVLIVQAHPFRPHMERADPALLDGVETYNACVRHVPDNASALAFAKEHGLLMTAGSDSHRAVDIGRAWMKLPPMRDEKELTRVLREYARREPEVSSFPQPRKWD